MCMDGRILRGMQPFLKPQAMTPALWLGAFTFGIDAAASTRCVPTLRLRVFGSNLKTHRERAAQLFLHNSPVELFPFQHLMPAFSL